MIPHTKRLSITTQKGFTFIELITVLAIVSVILSFAVLNLRQAQNQTSLNSLVPVVIADIKNQQVKAMTGFSQGGSAPSHQGIYFSPQEYVLFQGTTYAVNDPKNFVVPLEENFRFEEITFPDSQLLFSPSSGEVTNFSSTNNTVTIRNINDNTIKRIVINQLGVITEVEEE